MTKRKAVCTKDAPWREGMDRMIHPDARELCGSQQDGYPGGDLVTYECPNCGKQFEIELPQ